MGRFARRVVEVALADPEIDVTLLLERERDEPALRRAFSGRRVAVRPSADARESGRHDAVWYPWNGMRFDATNPALVTLHDVFAFTEPARGFIARRREQGPIRRAVRRAARIATDSAFSREEIVRVLHVPRERMSVVELAPEPFFVPGPSQVPPELAGRRFALFVAGPEARKNAAFFFDVATRALHAPHETLAIVGNLGAGSERALASTGVAHVRFDADDELLRSLYRTANVVCVPSLAEGFGLVAAEALACGAPVIASSTSSLPEATGGAALLADPRDVNAWVRALRSVLDDPATAAELQAKARARFPLATRDEPAHATLRLLRSLAAR
ncbi:MAG: glycosyltransferase [Candidatus Baltobacteraceae bacterium]